VYCSGGCQANYKTSKGRGVSVAVCLLENGVNILKSIDEGPFQMGTFQETLAEGNEDKERYNTDIRATNILLQGLPNDIYTLINHYTDAKDIWDNVKMLLEGQGNNPRGAGAASNGGVQNRAGNANPDYFKDKMLRMQDQEISVLLDEEQLMFLAGGYDTAVDEDVDEPPVQDLALNVDNVFQADECDAFDSDIDEALTAHTMFMANLSSVDPVYDEVGPSYDSDILSEVHDHDNYQDVVCEHHEVHEIHGDVQPNCIVDSDAEYTGDSNMIPYDQYVKDNAKPVVQNNVSSIPNDAYMMIINKMHDQTTQCVYVKV
ncbi:hypothetical protein Tco_1372962, partial [Tanacetum coccineum]